MTLETIVKASRNGIPAVINKPKVLVKFVIEVSTIILLIIGTFSKNASNLYLPSGVATHFLKAIKPTTINKRIIHQKFTKKEEVIIKTLVGKGKSILDWVYKEVSLGITNIIITNMTI